LIFLGPPGIGKGTQAKLISKKFSLAHLSTGDMFRSHINQETEVGLLAKSYIDKGKLVPDSMVLEMVQDRLGESDTSGGFIFDGFPRTKVQSIALDKFLKSLDIFINQVISLVGKDEILVERLSSRRTCLECGSITNLIFSPPKVEMRCDQCGAELFQRNDDKKEVILKRLEVYRDQTKTLVDYYEKKGLLVQLSGIGTVEEVTGRIEEHLYRKNTEESC
jgi:adenylate kinase